MNQERLMTVLLSPYISEKATLVGDANNQYVFKVATDATKVEVKKAIEQLFSVAVDKVRVLNVKAKTRRTRHGIGKRSGWRKAYVSLAEGHDIDFTKIQAE